MKMLSWGELLTFTKSGIEAGGGGRKALDNTFSLSDFGGKSPFCVCKFLLFV